MNSTPTSAIRVGPLDTESRDNPHLRRLHATARALAAGANVKAVQRMLGHASAAMTLDIYAGLFGDELDGVADALDDLVPRTRHIGPGEVASRCWQRRRGSADLRKRLVGRVGLEPTTDGL